MMQSRTAAVAATGISIAAGTDVCEHARIHRQETDNFQVFFSIVHSVCWSDYRQMDVWTASFLPWSSMNAPSERFRDCWRVCVDFGCMLPYRFAAWSVCHCRG